jgi:hypothetical protein
LTVLAFGALLVDTRASAGRRQVDVEARINTLLAGMTLEEKLCNSRSPRSIWASSIGR